MPRAKRTTPIERLTAMTLEEIAAELQVSPQRISQIEKRALKKLKRELLARKIVTQNGRYAGGEA